MRTAAADARSRRSKFLGRASASNAAATSPGGSGAARSTDRQKSAVATNAQHAVAAANAENRGEASDTEERCRARDRQQARGAHQAPPASVAERTTAARDLADAPHDDRSCDSGETRQLNNTACEVMRRSHADPYAETTPNRPGLGLGLPRQSRVCRGGRHDVPILRAALSRAAAHRTTSQSLSILYRSRGGAAVV